MAIVRLWRIRYPTTGAIAYQSDNEYQCRDLYAAIRAATAPGARAPVLETCVQTPWRPALAYDPVAAACGVDPDADLRDAERAP